MLREGHVCAGIDAGEIWGLGRILRGTVVGSQLGIDISDFLFIFEIYKIYKFSLFKIYLSWQDLSNLHRSVALPSAFR